MSDEPNKPCLSVVPTAQDEMAGAFEGVSRMYRAMIEHAVVIGQTRKALFDAYREAGFTEGQALELCKGSLVI